MYTKKRKFIPLSWVIIITLLLMCIASNVQNNNRSLNVLGYRPVLVVSGSMLPDIKINSFSIMQYCDIEDIEVGDVVMYYHPEMDINITHRCVRKITDDNTGEQFLITKGDANAREDGIAVTNEELIGKLVKTFNNTAPFVSLIMSDNEDGEVIIPVFYTLLFLLASAITVITMILGYITEWLKAAFYVLFRRHDVDNAVAKLAGEEHELSNIKEVCSILNREKDDKFGTVVSKIRLFNQIVRFNMAVGDTIGVMKSSSLISSGKLGELLKGNETSQEE